MCGVKAFLQISDQLIMIYKSEEHDPHSCLDLVNCQCTAALDLPRVERLVICLYKHRVV